MKARYLNPFTDFGFKKLFGEEASKPLLFELAELAHLTEAERATYEESLKHYRDMINVVDTARMEGKAEGRAEGRAEGLAEGLEQGERQAGLKLARQLLRKGFSHEEVLEMTGLELADLQGLE